MKNKLLACAALALLTAAASAQPLPAYDLLLRGGRVIEVTNLNDAGPGSLRAAVEAEGPRALDGLLLDGERPTLLRDAGGCRCGTPLVRVGLCGLRPCRRRSGDETADDQGQRRQGAVDPDGRSGFHSVPP